MRGARGVEGGEKKVRDDRGHVGWGMCAARCSVPACCVGYQGRGGVGGGSGMVGSVLSLRAKKLRRWSAICRGSVCRARGGATSGGGSTRFSGRIGLRGGKYAKAGALAKKRGGAGEWRCGPVSAPAAVEGAMVCGSSGKRVVVEKGFAGGQKKAREKEKGSDLSLAGKKKLNKKG